MDTLQVGDVSLTRIPHIEHWTLTATEFFPDMNPGTWTEHRDRLAPAHWNPATEQVRIAVQTWLLRSDDRLVLVDTGLSAATTRPNAPAGGDLPAALAAVGVTPRDIDLVICTHLHADHVGWNTRPDGDGGWTPTFPLARYLFSEPDLRFFHPDTLVEQPGRSAAVFTESIEPVLRAGRADIWDNTHTIDGSLRIDLAPGHTPGTGVVTVDSAGDRALLVGDLLHSPAQFWEPQASSCFCHAPRQAAQTRQQILGRAADLDALVIPAHFAGERAMRIRRDGTRFTPQADHRAFGGGHRP
ncbi:Glyoxylase, beta-lactamase superfamily II [Parafrankia irregularis]|uniref:Glyoxylase, beta-lactamase superfamily II n=1 Tax=Parafrankia irregularis TaxID=795642 RepID=A0A0S4QVC5_9ACTN|nr:MULTISPECIES: MBL fold metallo-hydrolase [Parafrankia]MBE3205785.1 MBL fold metallo-hydrolase [Parafrankia sp. CH37]CUU59659.1 Glyoxylase, beta-lactamase superfamily II [Parafrankia irregularis]